MLFTRISKTAHTIQESIHPEVLGNIWDLTNMPLVHGWDHGKIETFAMWSLGSWAVRLARFRQAGGRGRPEVGGGWPGGLLGSAGRLGRGGGRAGEGARRRPVAAAATARESRRGEARPAKGGRWEFQGGLGEVVEVSASNGNECGVELGTAVPIVGRRGVLTREGASGTYL
jgi:hypothetical protein